MAPHLTLLAVYDDGCRFCRVCVACLLVWDRAERVIPVGSSASETVGAPTASDSWHLRTGDGEWHSAGAALVAVLRALPGGRPLAALLGARPNVAEWGYRAVASRRARIGRLVPDRLVEWADRVITRRTVASAADSPTR